MSQELAASTKNLFPSFNTSDTREGTQSLEAAIVTLSMNATEVLASQSGCNIGVHTIVVGCTDTTAPDTPFLQPLSSPDSDGSYTLQWSHTGLDLGCSGLRGYEVWDSTSSSFSSYNAYFTTGMSYSITGKSDGTYYYKVYAVDDAGNRMGTVW